MILHVQSVNRTRYRNWLRNTREFPNPASLISERGKVEMSNFLNVWPMFCVAFSSSIAFVSYLIYTLVVGSLPGCSCWRPSKMSGGVHTPMYCARDLCMVKLRWSVGEESFEIFPGGLAIILPSCPYEISIPLKLIALSIRIKSPFV